MLKIEHPTTKEMVEVPDLVRLAGQEGIDKYVDLVGSGAATPAEALADVLPPVAEPATTEGGTS